jgi:hypothetical protein
MRYWYYVGEPKQDGPFKVVHSWTYEDTPIRDCFDDTCHDIAEMERKVDSGYLDWFVARVQYFYDGVEMGSAHLGGCLYEDVQKAFADGMDGYIEDMEDEAKVEAMDRLTSLYTKMKQDVEEMV